MSRNQNTAYLCIKRMPAICTWAQEIINFVHISYMLHVLWLFSNANILTFSFRDSNRINTKFLIRCEYNPLHWLVQEIFIRSYYHLIEKIQMKYLVSRYNDPTVTSIQKLKCWKGHPNIVSFVTNFVEVIKEESFTFIITEWFDGNELFQYVQKQ